MEDMLEPHNLLNSAAVLLLGLITLFVRRSATHAKKDAAEVKETERLRTDRDQRLLRQMAELERRFTEHVNLDTEAHERISSLEANLVPRDDVARHTRVEAIAARVHTLSTYSNSVDLLHTRVKDLELQMDQADKNASELRERIADLTATVREGAKHIEARFGDLSSRIEQSESSILRELKRMRGE